MLYRYQTCGQKENVLKSQETFLDYKLDTDFASLMASALKLRQLTLQESVRPTHRLIMEIDLQSLFVLLRTAVLIG
jgi:hypothetical protein